MKMELFPQKLIELEHFRRYAHALRFAIGLHGAWKFHPIVKYKHYQISSGARASLIRGWDFFGGGGGGGGKGVGVVIFRGINIFWGGV